jgi:4-amino-4-deoxy-L-arabinose transferase-like glycosyltransferase
VAAALCRGYRLRTPNIPAIFDETFYVNAARVILGLHVPATAPYTGMAAGLDPNREHPPLGKLLIAGSMRLFGDNGFGWRLPSLLAGIAAIVLLYLIVRTLSRDGWLAVLAAGIFAFDSLVLVHGRIATLDMPLVAFLLLGAWCWLRGWPLLAGVACAIAGLIKLPAVFGLAALVLLGVGTLIRAYVSERTLTWSAVRPLTLLIGAFVLVWVGGLWLLDVTFTSFGNPWAHLRYMLRYGFSIKSRGSSGDIDSPPWRWLINEVQMPYFRVFEKVTANGHVVKTKDLLDFKGAMNPAVIGAASLAIPYVVWRAWRLREPLSLFVVAWVAATYLPYYPLAVFSHRTTYLFYILPTLPVLAIAIAQLLRQARLPRAVTWGYLVAVLIGFVLYFPFRNVF